MTEEEEEIEENGQKIPSDFESDKDDEKNTDGNFSLINRAILKAVEDSIQNATSDKTLTDGRSCKYVPHLELEGQNYFETVENDNEHPFLKAYADELSPKKLQLITKSHQNNMVFPDGDVDGNCFMESLKKGLFYKMNIESTLTQEEKQLVLGKTFTEKMQKYQKELRKLSTSNFPVLTNFAEELLTVSGVVFNIFQYSDEFISNPNVMKAQHSLDSSEEVTSLPVSYLLPVYIGCEEVSTNAKEKYPITQVVNLVYVINKEMLENRRKEGKIFIFFRKFTVNIYHV